MRLLRHLRCLLTGGHLYVDTYGRYDDDFACLLCGKPGKEWWTA